AQRLRLEIEKEPEKRGVFAWGCASTSGHLLSRATCSGSSIWTKCPAPGRRKSSDSGKNSWNFWATPLFREGSASPKMIRTGRVNPLSLGIISVRDLTVDNKSSFKRKKAGRALGVASNC